MKYICALSFLAILSYGLCLYYGILYAGIRILRVYLIYDVKMQQSVEYE